MKEKFNLLPLNIQMFAEGEDGGSEETPKTYSQEDMDKIIAERDKLKQANDNLSKENADHKRKAKEKLSEEEKKAQAQQEKDKQLEEAQKELLSIKMSKELVLAGFDDKTTNDIIESFNAGDNVEFAKTLAKCINSLVDKVRKEEKEKFQQGAKVPPSGSGKQKSGLDPQVERYINRKTSSNSAREMLFGKK